MPRGRPVTNRSVYYSENMRCLLEAAASVVKKRYWFLMQACGIEWEDLIQYGWYKQARYLTDEEKVRKHCFMNSKRAMSKYVLDTYHRDLILVEINKKRTE